MWVLQPETAGQQTIYLGTGDISIGRPLKKGSTVGKADILIFNEQSVSTIHATLHVEAAVQQGSQDFTHGSISITDVSKFGTHLTRPGSAEQRLVINQATQLQDGDVLRFGSKCRYRVQQLAASLVASSSCQAQQPQLQQQAAALNMQLSSSWQHTAVAGLGTGIEAPNGQAAAAVRHAFCVVQEDEEVSPPVLLALSVGRPLVTPAWVEAATTRKAWVEELPPVGQHRPGRLMVPAGVQPGPEGQGPSWLNLADWQGASPGLLSAFLLVFDQRDTGDLAEAAVAWGADVTRFGQYGVGGVLAAIARQQAGSTGNSRFPVFVRPTQWSGVSEQQQQQQQGEDEEEGEQQPTGPEDGLMACVKDLQLLDAILSQTAEALEAARDEFQAQHHGLMQQQQQHRAAAAAGHGGGEDGDATEADETEGEEEEHAAAAAAGGAAGAAAAAAQQAGVTPAPQPPSSSNPGRTAVRTDSAADGDGWHTHAPGSSTASQRTQARTAGTKRGAAAAAAAASDATGAAAAAPASKRRRTAASPTKTPLDLQRKPTQQQQQQQQEQQPAPESGAAGNAGTQQQQQDGLGLNAEVTVALCVTGPVRQPARGAVGAGGPQVPNYKAFRRRGEVQQQQQQQAVLAIGLVAAEAPHLQGPDIDTFLRDEKHRQDRLRKADELFNANLKASKAPPMTKPAARPRKK